ncbi:MAG: FG-GAP repeat domain-containing protein [Puniceicoccaceae bacterium]
MKKRSLILSTLTCLTTIAAFAGHPVSFEVKLLAIDTNEGCDIADYDGDGKLDFSAGRSWYRNGDWIPRPVRNIEENNGYSCSNGEWAYDVDGDGDEDIISISFFDTNVYWYENPGKELLMQGALWPQHLLVDSTRRQNEVSFLVDINNDDVPEWHCNHYGQTNPTVFFTFTTEEREVEVKKGRKMVKEVRVVPTLKGHQIGSVNCHGVGFGDINGDGRDDVIFGKGWYECPEGYSLDQEWTYHADWDIPHCACPMLVKDFDGDGRNDIINSNAHGFGLHFWKNLGPDADGTIQWDRQLIDDSVSQYHCLHLADLDGDGNEEIVTGKRVRAHNGKDPGGKDPAGMYYYAWNDDSEGFTRYTIDYGNVGIGLQIRTADIDNDGDLDIAVAGKEGTQILFNQSI